MRNIIFANEVSKSQCNWDALPPQAGGEEVI